MTARPDAAVPVPSEISAADFHRRATARLSLDLPPGALDHGAPLVAGDHLVSGRHQPDFNGRPRAAAVLLAVIDRGRDATVLLTQRASNLRDHSGQIALPGGKIDASDASPAAAALREAHEEVGLDPASVTPLGYLDPYLSGTGFLIVPTVALVNGPVAFRLNPVEVEEAFEVPLGFLMEATNHQRSSRDFKGLTRSFYVMPYAERRIWGITAGIIRNLYERLYR